MLKCSLTTPNEQIAEFVRRFLDNPDWVRRRVETISFIDSLTTLRKTTLDIEMTTLLEAAGGGFFLPATPLVPLAVFSKDLLSNFDVRDHDGSVLSIVPRDIDSFFAWSFLCKEAARVLRLNIEDLSSDLSSHLYRISYSFPHNDDRIFEKIVRSWTPTEPWGSGTSEQWQLLVSNEEFSRFLRDFTFNYILIAQLSMTPTVQVIKYAYQLTPPLNGWTDSPLSGVTPLQFSFYAPSIGWERSSHVQIHPPSELMVTKIALVRRAAVDEPTESTSDFYHVRFGNGYAQIQAAKDFKPANFSVVVLMRASIVGIVRAAWLSTLMAATVLFLGGLFLHRLQQAVSDRGAESAVALLLVVPTLIGAYLVAPAEHALSSRILRPWRYIAAFSGLLTYVGGAALVLHWTGKRLEEIWWTITGVAILDASILTLGVILNLVDLHRNRTLVGRTIRVPVLDLPL